jgi:hypothetical protein
MTFDFDVFVSYARADETFACEVAEMLAAAGLIVWLDHEQLAPGSSPEEVIEAALQASRHAVFIISDHWLDSSDWTRWELEGFVRSDAFRRVPDRIAIPIVRGGMSRRLPPGLSGVKELTWAPGADNDVQFWLLFCGLTARKPGRRRQWKSEGQRARGLEIAAIAETQQELEADTIARGRRYAREMFSCNRGSQWGDVIWRAGVEQDEVLIVNGSRSEAHHIFLDRIYELLPNDPAREIIKIGWYPWPPKTQPKFVAALAEALGCPRRDDAVAAALRDKLADRNLILLHEPVVHDVLGDSQFVQYYSQWLPELLKRADARGGARRRGHLKAVQGISWPYVPWIVSWCAAVATPPALQGLPLIRGAVQRRHSELLRGRLAKTSERLAVFTLDELRRIRRVDVAKWADGVPDVPDRQRFVREVMAGWWPTSATILHRIVELLGGFREWGNQHG